MSRDHEDGTRAADGGRQDAVAERGRPDPARPPVAGHSLVGRLGPSDRPARRRLYLPSRPEDYVEVRDEDVLDSREVADPQAADPGPPLTKLTIREGAVVDHVSVRAHRPVDEFDLDVRFVGSVDESGPSYAGLGTWEVVTCDTCVWTCEATCRGPCETDYTCYTCGFTLCTAACPDGFTHPSGVETSCETCDYFQRCPG
jgi:hypothetical protein